MNNGVECQICLISCGVHLGGEWDEDDFIAIEEAPPSPDRKELTGSSTMMYFEYTDEPTLSPSGGSGTSGTSGSRAGSAITANKKHDQERVMGGRIRLKCPPYGGLFQLVYCRSQVNVVPSNSLPQEPHGATDGEEFDVTGVASPAAPAIQQGNSEIVRSNTILATSEILSVPFPLQHIRSTSAGQQKGSSSGAITALVSSTSKARPTCRGNRGRGGVESISVDSNSPLGVKWSLPEQYDTMHYIIEDMRNINNLAISVGAAFASPQSGPQRKFHTDNDGAKQSLSSSLHRGTSECLLSKVAAWVTIFPTTGDVNICCVTIEADATTKSDDCATRLSYSVVIIPVVNGWTLDLDQAYGVITHSPEGNDSLILIKIPYFHVSSGSLSNATRPSSHTLRCASDTADVSCIDCPLCLHLIVPCLLHISWIYICKHGVIVNIDMTYHVL